MTQGPDPKQTASRLNPENISVRDTASIDDIMGILNQASGVQDNFEADVKIPDKKIPDKKILDKKILDKKIPNEETPDKKVPETEIKVRFSKTTGGLILDPIVGVNVEKLLEIRDRLLKLDEKSSLVMPDWHIKLKHEDGREIDPDTVKLKLSGNATRIMVQITPKADDENIHDVDESLSKTISIAPDETSTNGIPKPKTAQEIWEQKIKAKLEGEKAMSPKEAAKQLLQEMQRRH